jgi:hypothetical protein
MKWTIEMCLASTTLVGSPVFSRATGDERAAAGLIRLGLGAA